MQSIQQIFCNLIIFLKAKCAQSFVNYFDKHCARIKELEVTKPRVCCLLTRALSRNMNAIISLSKWHYYNSIYIFREISNSKLICRIKYRSRLIVIKHEPFKVLIEHSPIFCLYSEESVVGTYTYAKKTEAIRHRIYRYTPFYLGFHICTAFESTLMKFEM